MSHKLQLSLACGDYEITRPLMDGRVEPAGIELTVITPESRERHWRVASCSSTPTRPATADRAATEPGPEHGWRFSDRISASEQRRAACRSESAAW
jgi:hypothetical protein